MPQGSDVQSDAQHPVVSAKHLSERVSGAFSSAYLTLISIIQGAAFAYLAGFGVANYSHFKTPIAWILVCTSFVIIVLGWNEYLMGALAFVWIPTLLDAVIPFGLGVIEVLLITAIADDPQTWLAFLTLFALAGVIAYANLYGSANAPRYKQENAAAFSALGRWPLITIVWSVVSVFAFCALFLTAHFNPSLLDDHGFGTSMALSLVALTWVTLFFVRGWWYWARISRKVSATLGWDN